MRCNPLRWLWGLLPIAALGYAVTQYERARIETDLTQRVENEMRGKGLRWASVKFDGRDGRLTGRAIDEADPQTASQLALNTWGVRVVENRSELIEKADAYAWWADHDGRRVVVKGLVPNDNTRQSILGVARQTFPGMTVVDEMRLARGVPSPDTWLTGIDFGLKQLRALKSGEVRLDGLGLSLSGEAASQAQYAAVKTALASGLPNNIRLTDDRVTPPLVKPYTWAARSANRQITLSGHVPNARARADVQNAARDVFKRDAGGRLDFGDGAPTGFAPVVATALKELGRLEEGAASLTDTTLTFDGLAADEATAQTVRRALRAALPANYRLNDQIRFREPTPPPPPPAPVAVSPYTGGLDLEANRLVLSGFAPSEAVRGQIEQSARARFPGRTIDNRIVIGPGAPDGWQRCFDGGMLGLARVGSGRMALSDRRLDVIARTDDEDLLSAVPLDVRSAVQGACDATVRLDYVAPPEPDLRWSARRDGDVVTLSGEVSSSAARAALLAQARRQFPRADVRDTMRVVENKSKNWPRAAELALASLADVTVGEAILDRQAVTVIGEMRYEPTALERVRERIRREMPRGYAGREQITMLRPPSPPQAQPAPPAVPPAPRVQTPVIEAPAVSTPAPQPQAVPQPPRGPSTAAGAACQNRLRDAARDGVISFDRARALLTGESTQTLDRIAAIARNCPGVRIEIEGHTDSEGTPERNQGLSERRAQAVLNYLSRQGGVDPGILSAAGYGETRPVAPNDTATNRARNRRIDFTVSD
jgi:OmpA-OmpF porin, OOP family